MNWIWCPSLDPEITEQMDNFIKYFPNAKQLRCEGGRKQLAGFDAQSDKLYIIAHGHGEMPLFNCNGKYWTPEQLVSLLKSDGLPKDCREIELLVCHAGESVNSASIGNQLVKIFNKSKRFEKVPLVGPSSMKKGREEYSRVQLGGQQPSAFDNSDQLIPLAAQFSQALKQAGYTNFRITSYGAAVAQNFTGGKVTLDLKKKGGKWGAPLEENGNLIKIWH